MKSPEGKFFRSIHSIAIVAIIFVALFAVAGSAHASYITTTPQGGCNRDNWCGQTCSGGGQAWCVNRVCKCETNEAPPFCAASLHCSSLPYCVPGSAKCGGQDVQVNGDTVHVVSCRGILSEPDHTGAGVLSYCSNAGKITGRCVGWPNPHVEIWWSPTSPGAAKNSNSILRDVNGTGNWWLYGGGPGIAATRINGSPANPGDFSVTDLRDNGISAGNTYTYTAKYRPETPSLNQYIVTVNSANCGGPPPTPIPPATHLVCQNNACVSVNGGGANQCATNADCIPVTHMACQNQACVSVNGAGPDTCTNVSCIPAATHLACQNQACVSVPGAGANACGSGCVTPTHMACQNNACTAVAGAGPNECSSTAECSGGTIRGVCRWVGGAPQVQLTWSQYPPPGQGAANSNGLQKGDSAPSDPNQYWGFLPNDPSLYAYNDSAVVLDTQYQYRVKYRSDLPSINTYNIYVSRERCGAPALPPAPLSIEPTFQNVPPSVTAFLRALGGAGNYSWSAPDGTISGSGSLIGVTYTNASTQPITKTVNVTSGSQTAAATVRVEGVNTFQDSIDLTGPGKRNIIINNDEPVTPYFDVGLTLAHGFTGVASDSIQVQLSNTLTGVTTAPKQAYQKAVPWNLCDSPGYCDAGTYTVFAIYTAPGNSQSPIVMDNILYTLPSTFPPAGIEINGGAATTTDRSVTLSLDHGLGAIPVNEIGMQVANRADLVNSADVLEFTPELVGWDICSGLGPTCPNGTRTVFVKYCGRGQCTGVVQDSIQLNSAWPDWGIRINDDAPTTGTGAVSLKLNPFFNLPGTRMFISNLDDFSDAATRSFAALVPWDLCTSHVGPCTSDTYTVYVRYENDNGAPFPDPKSPRYEDVIALVTASPLPPAAILLDNGAAFTTDRVVSVHFTSPFGAQTGVSMRPVNEKALTPRDQVIIKVEFGGGIESQPNRPAATEQGTQGNTLRASTPTPTPNTRAPGTVNQTLRAVAADFPQPVSELESGTVRPFVDQIPAWDLCGIAVDCPYGTYKVYVQYYHTPTFTSTSGSLAAAGDEVSSVYVDSIEYLATTPTPTPTGTPVPSGTPVLPTGTPGPTGTPIPPIGLPPIGLPPWVPQIIVDIINALAGAEPLIGALAFASAIAVIISALATLLPLIGPGLIAFSWQWFMGAVGILPRRKKTWGTVYDSNTKRPIPYAKVQLLDRNRRVLETRVADKDGRYGFLTTPESLQAKNVQIAILPSVSGYTFPSKVAPSIDTFVYNNLYYGDVITVNEKTLINFDVPMDPIKPSHASLIVKSPSIALGASVAALADAGFWLGLILVPLSFVLNPNPFTFGTLCLFLGTASLRLFGISEHPFGTITDAQTGRAMPFALITLNDLTGKRVAFAVSDEQGRYFLVVDRGTYELIAYTSAGVQPPRQTKQRIEAKKGWITRELKL